MVERGRAVDGAARLEQRRDLEPGTPVRAQRERNELAVSTAAAAAATRARRAREAHGVRDAARALVEARRLGGAARVL